MKLKEERRGGGWNGEGRGGGRHWMRNMEDVRGDREVKRLPVEGLIEREVDR